MNDTQPAGNYYDKYHTSNPIARMLMRSFLRAFEDLVSKCPKAKSVLEVGCGEGELSIRLARRYQQVTGVDISSDIVEEARRRAASAGATVSFRATSIFSLDLELDRADLVVCCEVMEHLDNSQLAVDHLHALCGKYLITSVPREPLWRALNLARGKYIQDFGNTPGHVQHWSRSGFRALLETRFRVVELRSPVPWTMALCIPK